MGISLQTPNVDGNNSETDYYSEEVTGTDFWQSIDSFSFVSSSIDLRISNADAEFAFVDPGTSNSIVGYGTAESPIVGLPVNTPIIYYRRDSSASSDATIDIQIWE